MSSTSVVRATTNVFAVGAFVIFLSAGCSPSDEPVSGSGTGGGASIATGGRVGTGGGTASGGTNSTGGASETGGANAAGGAGSGGRVGTGGSAVGTGGASTGTGGTPSTGGSGTGGNTTGSTGGGSVTTGGVGGDKGTGGSSGVAGSSGSGGTVVVAPCATNQISMCTGSNPISCHFGGNPGNYEVTVELGGAAAGDTYVDAESYRRMLAQTTTAAGQAKRFSFVTNVRVYEGEPLRPDQDSTYPKGTPGLDIYLRGPTPRVTSICQQPMQKPLMFWTAGDSTVCDQAGTDYAGWGQHLPQHFVSPVSVANYADSGESSASFLSSAKLWGAIKAGMKTGDWVIIQLGHNDKDVSTADFKANLTAMLNDAKSAGAHAILVTPISRVGYTLAEEHVSSMKANLPQIIRDLGKSQGIPVIDLTVTTWNWIQTVTWQDYFALGTDHTHTNPKGAEIVAGFVRDAIRAQVPALSTYLR